MTSNTQAPAMSNYELFRDHFGERMARECEDDITGFVAALLSAQPAQADAKDDLINTLKMIRYGLSSGAVKSKQIMCGNPQTDASMEIKSLGTIIDEVLAKAIQGMQQEGES